MGDRFGSDVLPHQRRPVAWYSPAVLWQAARELLSSKDFLRNLDRRETFGGTELKVIDLRGAFGAGEVGFDFIADTGDGGNATYTVAQGATAATLATENAGPLDRPPLVVLGGDLAYPGASSRDYHYRFLEPFTIASSQGGGPPSAWSHVLAIPQNHDWFDSVLTFSRYFVGRAGQRDFVGADAPQDRTYFAACLPHRWWILGLDFALGGDIDRTQFEAFRSLWDPSRAGPRIEPGDQVILVYPEPYWTRRLSEGTPGGYTRRFQRLEHLLEAAADRDPARNRDEAGGGAAVRLRLAGDLHHYAGRTAMDRSPAGDLRRIALVTCGTGGAFMHTTHGAEVQGDVVLDRSAERSTVPESLGRRTRVGLPDDTIGDDHGVLRFPDASTQGREEPVFYPSRDESLRLARRGVPGSMLDSRARDGDGFFAPLLHANLGIGLLIGLLYVLNASVNAVLVNEGLHVDRKPPALQALPLSWSLLADWMAAMVSSPPALAFNGLMMAICVWLGWDGTWGRRVRWTAGLLHGALHALLIFLLYYALASAVLGSLPPAQAGLPQRIVLWVGMFVCSSVFGSLLLGCGLAALSVWGRQITDKSSSAMAIEDYKGFLRVRITPHALTTRFVACRHVPKTWKKGSDGRPEPDAKAVWRVEHEIVLPTP